MPTSVGGRRITSTAQLGTGVVESDDIATDTIVAADIAANAIGDSEISAHTTTKLTVPFANVTGTVPEAQIADNAVTLAKMASGTDGNLITYDTSGDPAAVATGDAGEFLKSAGAGAAPSFSSLVPTNVYLPLADAAGAGKNVTSDTPAINMADGGGTNAYAFGFVPLGTIDKIELVWFGGGTSNNVKMGINATDWVDGTITADNAVNILADTAGANEAQFSTIDAGGYDGLTQGRCWSFFCQRDGAHANDTAAATIHVMGLLITYS